MIPDLMPTTIPVSFPSLHDGTQLEGRILIPDLAPDQSVNGGAVLAHPYAPLGGCFDDPVVQLLARQFLSNGFVVGTFNFRGAGLSAGKTSWSSEPEQKDYASFAGILVCYISRILALQQSSREEEEVIPRTLRIVLGGYSYGSMIASQAAPASNIYDSWLKASEGSVEADLVDRAQALRLLMTLPEIGRESASPPEIQTFYLLVSPLLPPVSRVLALSTAMLNWKTKDRHLSLLSHPSLAIFGGQDVFTSKKKLCTWADETRQIAGNRFEFDEIEEAGHFWRETGVANRLRQRIATWIKETVLQ